MADNLQRAVSEWTAQLIAVETKITKQMVSLHGLESTRKWIKAKLEELYNVEISLKD